MYHQNPPQKVKFFLSVNNDTKILGIKYSKTCCIIDLSSYWVAKLERSIRERTGFFIFSEVLYDEACVSFGAKFFNSIEEVVVDMTYLYYLTGQGNRNDTNRMNCTPG